MATHNEVRSHLEAEQQAAKTAADQAEAHWRVLNGLIAGFDDLKATARQRMISEVQAGHACADPGCPVSTWQDALG